MNGKSYMSPDHILLHLYFKTDSYVYRCQISHSFIFHFSLIFIQCLRGTGAYPSCHCMKGRIHSGQVNSPLQGQYITNNHAHSLQDRKNANFKQKQPSWDSIPSSAPPHHITAQIWNQNGDFQSQIQNYQFDLPCNHFQVQIYAFCRIRWSSVVIGFNDTGLWLLLFQ